MERFCLMGIAVRPVLNNLSLEIQRNANIDYIHFVLFCFCNHRIRILNQHRIGLVVPASDIVLFIRNIKVGIIVA